MSNREPNLPRNYFGEEWNDVEVEYHKRGRDTRNSLAIGEIIEAVDNQYQGFKNFL